MTGFQQVLIGGYPTGGLTQDRKPAFLANEAFSDLQNAYVWRERTKKRDGEVPMGRFRRVLSAYSLGPSQASVWNFNILTVTGYVLTADNANPGEVTTKYPHHLSTGDTVVITGIVGATGYNNKLFTIIVTSPTKFTVGANAAAFGAYASGGQWISNRALTITGSIFAANNANPGQITTTYPHNLANGDKVLITGVNGATGYNNTLSTLYTITVTGINTFTVGVNAATFGVYTSGGTYAAQNTITRAGVEPYAAIQCGSVVFTIGGITFTDQGNGLLTSTTPGNSGTINYITGDVSITHTAGVGIATTLAFNYFPALPVMGILKRDVPTIGIDATVYFDTVYAYQYINGFQELSPGTVWTGSNTDFFWAANYQGATPDLRYFFVTNNNITLGSATPYDPIRYYNNSVWTDLQPLVTATITLWEALIVIPYYGRLLALNTWEGATAGGVSAATNFFSRCRFSQFGNPVGTNSWRQDIFGLGGFLDAPTNEAIISAAFFRNTLIVFFEYSTWQLRYIGEYGLPFIFERVSSDFGSVSTYSPIVFDQGVMTVSDRGIIQAAANGVSRLDEQIPEQVFSFQIQNSAPNFVHGIRDFEKELVYWNYLDVSANVSTTQTYPNTVLLFNYKNNTWAKFRDTITCFGPSQFQFGVTWDSLTVFWESTISWDNVDDQQYVDYVSAGTQAGFINIYQNPDASTPEPDNNLYAPTMAITAVDFTTNPNLTQITIPSHNLENGEIIYIQNAIWSGTDPGLNNKIYRVTIAQTPGPNPNVITLETWNEESQSYDPVNITSTAVYLGCGIVTLFPKMNIVGKDFNPFQGAGKQFKLSFIDFQMDANIESPSITAVTVQLFVNSYLGEQANLIAANQELINSSQGCGFITFATQANPCKVTSKDHSLITGTSIYIGNIPTNSMSQLNGANYTITVVDANNFTLNSTDSTGFTAFDPTTTGIWNSKYALGQTYQVGSEYAWYRFYSTQFGQYLRIGITYDDSLMNQLSTHQTGMELNAMNVWFREGGRLIN